MIPPLEILILSDGKPGHLNQSLGLAEALARRCPTRHRIEQTGRNPLRALLRHRAGNPAPDLVLGAGHATHLPLLKLARQTDALAVVLMKPSLPVALFDLCVMPQHDVKGASTADNIALTRGALNRVPPPAPGHSRRGGLVLIGGPSAVHGWDPDPLISAICQIVTSCGDRPWRVTDSRRTPAGFLDQLTAACPAVVAHPHTETGPEWVPQRLAESTEVWVGEDSVSMIYESLSSGASVGLLPTPRKSAGGRVLRGIDRLRAESWVTPFDAWTPGQALGGPPRVLREADRVAGEILRCFFPSLPTPDSRE